MKRIRILPTTPRQKMIEIERKKKTVKPKTIDYVEGYDENDVWDNYSDWKKRKK